MNLNAWEDGQTRPLLHMMPLVIIVTNTSVLNRKLTKETRDGVKSSR